MYALACGMAADAEAVAPLVAVTRGLEQAESTLLGVGGRVSADAAAFANGARVHSRAQDDTHYASQCHPGTTIIPAVLALAEREECSGQDVLTALVVGYEVAAAVGEELVDGVVARGFRATMVFGTLGAAAACASLHRLGPREAANAIAIGTSFAGGLTETWLAGSSEWLWQAGAAARNGLCAAELAAAGAAGAASALEGAAGFARAFGDRPDWRPPDWALGERWRTLEVVYKPYPICDIAQAPVALALGLATDHDLRADDVVAVRCFLNPDDHDYPGTLNRGPFAGAAAALMSVPYCTALALENRGVTVARLRALGNPRTAELVARCDVLPDSGLPPLGARLELEIADGRVLASQLLPGGELRAAGWTKAVAAAERLAPEMGPQRARLPEVQRLAQRLDRLRRIDELTLATAA